MKDQTINAIPKQILRAYDIRGHVEVLNPEVLQLLAYALAQQFKEAGQLQLVLGYDARLSSPLYAQIMAQGLCQAGIKVLWIGCVSSPLLYFSAKQYGGGNGIMITASHNPVTDNGIKWMLQGLAPTPQQIQQLSELSTANRGMSTRGTIQRFNPLPDYLDYLRQDIHLVRPVKICVDGMHGSAGAIALAALTQFDCEVIALHCEADGHFPQGPPDPSRPDRLAQLQALVVEQQAAMGIALDGDGDRLVIIDETGRYISPDRLMSLFAKICLAQNAGQKIVCDVKCSSMIADTVAKYHGQLAMIRTGSSFLRNYLQQQRAIFGGEFAGHYVFNDGRGQGYDDGLYAALRLLEYLTQQSQSLSQLLAEFAQRVATPDLYVPTAGADYAQFAAQLQSLACKYLATINKVDGIRLDFPFGFGIIRASNTGDFFTVRFDADSYENLHKIRQIFVEAAFAAQFTQIAQLLALADGSIEEQL
jgi:phosphomannomutase/phosphoglucomutase